MTYGLANLSKIGDERICGYERKMSLAIGTETRFYVRECFSPKLTCPVEVVDEIGVLDRVGFYTLVNGRATWNTSIERTLNLTIVPKEQLITSNCSLACHGKGGIFGSPK